MGKYLVFLYILTVFFQAQILAEMDSPTMALLQQGLNSKCSDFSEGGSSYNKDNIQCTAINEISNNIFSGDSSILKCSTLKDCPICKTPDELSTLWDKSKKQIENLLQYGKDSCQCCETPEQCFASEEGFSSMMGNLRTTGNLLTATATGAGMASGHRKMCEILSGLQGGLAAVNGAAGANCMLKGDTCTTNYGECLSQLNTLEEKIQNIFQSIENVANDLPSMIETIERRLIAEIQPFYEKQSRDSRIKGIQYNERIENKAEADIRKFRAVLEACGKTKTKYEKIFAEIESLKAKLDENKEICEHIHKSGKKLAESGTAYGLAAAVAHQCSENEEKNENPELKNCLITPTFPECCQNPFIYSSYTEQCRGEIPPCEVTAQNPAVECPGFCENNSSDERCQKEETNICLTDPENESCNTGGEDEDEDTSIPLSSENEENTNNNTNTPNFDDDGFLSPPPGMPFPQNKNSSGGSGGGPRGYGKNPGGSGSSGLGGLGGSPGGDGEEEEEEDEEGEEDPYKDLLQGLSGGKQNSDGLTGSGGSFGKGFNDKDNNKSKFNLKKFLPKNLGRVPSSLLGLSRDKTIFDIHSEVMKGYCKKYDLECIEQQKK